MIKNSEYIYPEKLPFFRRLKIYCDFNSRIKSIWLTGYLLITWEESIRAASFQFYRDGSYE